MKNSDSYILTINGGSSSIKFAVYQVTEPLNKTIYGKIDRIGSSGTMLTFNDQTNDERQSLNICKDLEFLGIELDEKQNKTNSPIISTNNLKVTVRVIHTDEEWIIAKTVNKLISIN